MATFELVVWLAAALAAVVFVLVPKRLVLVLPAVAAVALAFASVAATREVAQRASFDQENYLGGERGWVDRVAGEPVAYLYYGERYWNGVWQQLFWNRRIRQVYAPEGIPPPPGLPLTVVRGEPDGRLLRPNGTPIPERLLVASTRNRLRGEPVAEIQQRFLEEPGLTLWRLDPPARLDTVLTGLRPEGDMHGPAVMRVWDCRAGRLDLTLLPKLSRRVELRVNGRTKRVLTLAGEPFVNATLFPPAGARTCTFEVVPDNLLGSTQFAFVRD